jgi:hypothetical protein
VSGLIYSLYGKSLIVCSRCQIWRFAHPPPAPPATYEDSPMLQLAYCNLWTFVTFGWCYDVMKIGYQRPLQATDLRKIDREYCYVSCSETVSAKTNST